jgi:hypothetical protein
LRATEVEVQAEKADRDAGINYSIFVLSHLRTTDEPLTGRVEGVGDRRGGGIVQNDVSDCTQGVIFLRQKTKIIFFRRLG